MKVAKIVCESLEIEPITYSVLLLSNSPIYKTFEDLPSARHFFENVRLWLNFAEECYLFQVQGTHLSILEFSQK